MVDIFDRVVANLIDRVAGPLSFRLIMQPTMAVIVAISAGVRDARLGAPPYLSTLWSNPSGRLALLRLGVIDVSRVLIFATLVDIAYQMIVVRWVYPGEALLVAVLLAFVPYVIARGPANRIARRWLRPRGAS
jgi:uncharacterized membrane protein YedE/YeeE